MADDAKSSVKADALGEITERIRSHGLDPVILMSLAPDEIFAEAASASEEEFAPDDSQLVQFMRQGGQRPYRELIEYHLRKQSQARLQQSVMGEVSMLPPIMQPKAMGFIDATNASFGYDQSFWRQMSCFQAATAIWIMAAQTFANGESRACCVYPFSARNHLLAFGLFQIPTLSFAYSASSQRSQRQFMGISKGLFG